MSESAFLQPRRATQPVQDPGPSSGTPPQLIDLSAPTSDKADQPIEVKQHVEPLIPTPVEQAKAPSPIPEMGAGVWKLKDIGLWPDVRAGGMFRRNVRVLIQASSAQQK
jgi:hypothetical protein